jgi:hypothetical protein
MKILKNFTTYLLVLLVALFLVPIAGAQEGRPTPTPRADEQGDDGETPASQGTNQLSGSIRGTVYGDSNLDGTCTQDEARLVGIPVRFETGGTEAVRLQTGDDGSYGLVAAPFGEWTVVVEPPTGWAAVGNSSRQVTTAINSAETRTALGVDFCLTTASTSGGSTLLPAAGSPIASQYLFGILAAGLLLFVAGAGLEVRRRRS